MLMDDRLCGHIIYDFAYESYLQSIHNLFPALKPRFLFSRRLFSPVAFGHYIVLSSILCVSANTLMRLSHEYCVETDCLHTLICMSRRI